MNNKWHIEDMILKQNQGIIILMNKGKTRTRLVWLYGHPIIGNKKRRRS